jgi:integrase
MRGSLNYQVHQVFETLNCIGQSKHDAKASARDSGAKTWAEVGAKVGVYSYATADVYRDTWRHVLEHTKAEYGIKDIERLTGQHVASFLEAKIDRGVARATFDQYAAACAKLEQALNRFAEQKGTGNTYSFDLKDVRSLGAKELGDRSGLSRAYAAPEKLVAAVRGEQHALAAALQREGGARVKEVSFVGKDQLKGVWNDRFTGQARGWFEVQGKGGKVRLVGISPVTYERLAVAIAKAEHGRFEINGDRYREDLKQAAAASRQNYEGSHGLRWSWAQNRHTELQVRGMTYDQSLVQVSQEMGHARGDITEHYLK